MNNDNSPFLPGRRGFAPMVDHHGGPGALAWVIFALELLMLAALAVLLMRAFASRRPRFAGGLPPFKRHHVGATDPLEHVRWRYARGELTRDEYLQATRDLGGAPD